MKIDVSGLERVNPGNIGHKIPCECFFRTSSIQEMKDCAISTFGHLIKQRSDGSWFTPDLEYRHIKSMPWLDGYGYGCSVANDKRRFKMTIDEIIRRTFFPDAKRIKYPTGDHLPRRNKSVQRNNGKTKKNRPVKDVRKYIIFNSMADRIKYIQSKIDKTYVQEYHEFVNIPELPVIHKPPKQPKPQVLDDGTPVRDVPGLSIELINRKWSDIQTRTSNKKFKQRQDKIRYKFTTNCFKNRLSFQHWMNDNYYAYYDKSGIVPTLEIEKDIFGMLLDCYGEEECCIVPHYINMFFVTSKMDCEERGIPYIGYCITIQNSRKYPFYIPSMTKEPTGYSCPSAKFKTFGEALTEGRKRKADYMRSIISYESTRGYIPQYILDKLAEYPPLIEQGKIDTFEPTIDVVKKYGVTYE